MWSYNKNVYTISMFYMYMIVNDVQLYAILVEVASDLPILITFCVIL